MPVVLIVEDDEVIRRLAHDVLEDEGFEILTANSGDEALEVLAAQTPDAIVLDLLMPGIDARTFVERLPEAVREVPILVLSAAPDMSETAGAIGAAANLAKPFELDDFVAAVRGLVDR